MAYNGHRSKAYWNVSLWINNDEGLYRTALDLCRRMNRREAAMTMYDMLKDGAAPDSTPTTPDGYAYSIDKIQRAMIGLT